MLLQVALCAALLTNFAAASQAAQPEPAHDKMFWRMIVKNEFKLPAGSSASALALELSKSLGSSDPELRDDLAYDILATWIYKTHQVDAATLRALIVEWLENLRSTASDGDNAVLRRSFSALMLSVAVARDNADPFLEKQEFRKIRDGALTYLAAETDLRGFYNRLGWIHSAAHTADLLKFLARSRYATPDDQAVVLTAVQRKLSAAPVVLTYGEDERYARTVLAVIMRKDFDLGGFQSWAQQLGAGLHADMTPSEQALHGRQNLKNLLAKLDFILSTQTDATSGVHSAETAVRVALQDTF